jgi:toxin YhaV
LLFHERVIVQLQKLNSAAERARLSDPTVFEGNANVKLLRALSQLIACAANPVLLRAGVIARMA